MGSWQHWLLQQLFCLHKGCFASASSSNSAFKPKHLQLLPAQLRDEQHGRHARDTILGGACPWSLNPKINFKPLIYLWEHNKFVTEVIMKTCKLWSADSFGHAGFQQAFSLGHSSGGVLQNVWGALVWQMITARQRCWVRATGWLVLVLRWQWNSLGDLWLASELVNFLCPKTISLQMLVNMLGLFLLQLNSPVSFSLGSTLVLFAHCHLGWEHILMSVISKVNAPLDYCYCFTAFSSWFSNKGRLHWSHLINWFGLTIITRI